MEGVYSIQIETKHRHSTSKDFDCAFKLPFIHSFLLNQVQCFKHYSDVNKLEEKPLVMSEVKLLKVSGN
jgi:hypothetical protein